MVKIETLFKEKKVSRINELEKDRHLNFLSRAYLNNLEHSKFVQEAFPRWSMISGYYSMHDVSKLLLADKFNLKVEREAHATTVKLIESLTKNKELFDLIESGYHEFLSLASDLNEAKKERVKTQYYTGTGYSSESLREKALRFNSETVEPYLKKIRRLLGR